MFGVGQRQTRSHLMRKHPVQLVFADGQSLAIRAVHDQNDDLKETCQTPLAQNQFVLGPVAAVTGGKYLGVEVVRVPVGPETLLPSDVPNHEVCVSDCDLLNVAADGGRRVDGLFCQTGGETIKKI